MTRLHDGRWQFGFLVAAAIALAAALIGASQLGARTDKAAADRPGVAETSGQFAGIQQRGTVLGSPMPSFLAGEPARARR